MDVTVTRRAVIMGSGAACLAAMNAGASPFFKRSGIPVGVQLYTMGPELTAAFDPTLAELARIGYQRVELAGFLGRSAAQLRASFDRAGLVCRSAHVPAQAMTTPSAVAKLIDDARIIGLHYVVIPMFPFPPNAGRPRPGEDSGAWLGRIGAAITADEWKVTADLLNEKGMAFAAGGLRLAYHNHNVEFAPRGGPTGYEILMERTDPKLVSFEMDAGWVAAAGLDPLALLKRYPDRYRLMHVKDIKASTRPNFALQQDPTEVGSGIIDWKRILPAARAAGVQDFYVEQEPQFSGSRIEAVAKSFRYLQQLSA